MFKMMTGTFMVHIPYKGSAPALADLMGGRVDLMFDKSRSALPSIKSEKVRALATTTLKRSSFLPQLPTLDESGLKGFRHDHGGAFPWRRRRPAGGRSPVRRDPEGDGLARHEGAAAQYGL